jgi:hypothetical protein
MNADRQRAFDNYASKFDADQCDANIQRILQALQTNKSMKPSDRELWLEDLNGWIRHYRERTFNFS